MSLPGGLRGCQVSRVDNLEPLLRAYADADVCARSPSMRVQCSWGTHGDRGATTRTAGLLGSKIANLNTAQPLIQFLNKWYHCAFQLKSYLMVQESAASDEILLFFHK